MNGLLWLLRIYCAVAILIAVLSIISILRARRDSQVPPGKMRSKASYRPGEGFRFKVTHNMTVWDAVLAISSDAVFWPVGLVKGGISIVKGVAGVVRHAKEEKKVSDADSEKIGTENPK
jgi:hypothetical protein